MASNCLRHQIQYAIKAAELKKHCIAEVPLQLLAPPATLQVGREGLAGLLDRGVSTDVLVCGSDTVAQGGGAG